MTPSDPPTPKDKPPSSVLRAFACAFCGLGEAWKSERHIRIHVLIAVVAIALGLFLQIDRIEWGLIVFAISLVFTAELINTAVEKTLDRISDEIHPLTKSAKDISAGAVLVSACGAMIIGLLVFLPGLIELGW